MANGPISRSCRQGSNRLGGFPVHWNHPWPENIQPPCQKCPFRHNNIGTKTLTMTMELRPQNLLSLTLYYAITCCIHFRLWPWSHFLSAGVAISIQYYQNEQNSEKSLLHLFTIAAFIYISKCSAPCNMTSFDSVRHKFIYTPQNLILHRCTSHTTPQPNISQGMVWPRFSLPNHTLGYGWLAGLVGTVGVFYRVRHTYTSFSWDFPFSFNMHWWPAKKLRTLDYYLQAGQRCRRVLESVLLCC